MQNATSVLSVKFQSSLAPEALAKTCQEGLDTFRNIPGLIQKYYIMEEKTGAISGIYLFTSTDARDTFWNSDLAKTIPMEYGVILESLRVEQYEVAIVLNNTVAA